MCCLYKLYGERGIRNYKQFTSLLEGKGVQDKENVRRGVKVREREKCKQFTALAGGKK